MDNQEQVEYWNGDAGRTWVQAQQRLDTLLAPITAALLERAAPRAGERAIDVGCGCGETTLALADAGATVWGIDISAPMLERAKARAAGRKDVAFARTDAATQAYTPDHNLVFSRFGVMFFADPYSAFANLRSALTSDGRLCFACWQAPRDNPWVAIAGKAVQPFLPEPAETPDPRAPGPFAFAEEAYLGDILESAGYGPIHIDAYQTTLHLADTLEEAMTFLGEVGPLARALAELGPGDKERALDAARSALTPHLTGGGLDLGAACWLVTAGAG